MGLMRWYDGLEIETTTGRIPAFMYVMPDSTEISFVELTVLSSRPMLAPDALRAPLLDWAAKNDLKRVSDERPVERVIIPMGYDLPHLDQPVIGIGGSASQVHPATGYLLAKALHTVEALADRTAELRHETAEEAKFALWDAVWPTDAIRCHELYRFGLEVVLRMSPDETREFFAAFFDLPEEAWQGYLSRTLTTQELVGVMAQLFRNASWKTRARLASGVLRGEARHLVSALLK